MCVINWQSEYIFAGFDDRRSPKGCMPLLSRVLYGLVPSCWIENNFSKSDHGRHAKTAAWFPHQLSGNTSANLNR